MDSEDPLFMLYTSGSTGKPKVCRQHWGLSPPETDLLGDCWQGLLHTTGGYLTYAALSHKVPGGVVCAQRR